MAKAFKVDGLRQLEKSFAILRAEFGTKTGGIIVRGLKAGAELIQQDAKRRAPVGTRKHFVGRGRRKVKAGEKNYRERFGRLLRNNIVMYAVPFGQLEAGKLSVVVRVSNFGHRKVDGKIRFKRPGSSPGYWWLVEFGTANVPARPFLRPAFAAQARAATDAAIASMRAEVDRIFATQFRQAA